MRAWFTTERVCLIAILLLAAGLRLWGIALGLPLRVARPDESDIVVHALAFGTGDLNPHFFNYPTLFMYIVFAAYLLYFSVRLLLGPYSLSAFLLECRLLPYSTYLIPRGLSALAGIFTVLIVYRITARLFDKPAGLIAAFFMAVSHLHVRDSHFGVTDTAMVCLIMLATLLLPRCMERPSAWSWLLAGAAAGLATSIKYNALLLVVPILLMAALALFRATSDSVPRFSPIRGLLLCGPAFVFCFLLGTPYALLDYRTLFSDLTTESGRVYVDPTLPMMRAWRVHLETSLWYGLGWPVLFTGFAGLIVMVRRLRRVGWILLAFPLVYAVIAGVGYKAPYRYALPLVPFFCIGAGVLLNELRRRSIQHIGRSLAAATIALVTLAAAYPSLACVVRSNQLFCRTDSRVEAARWFQEHVPANASVYQRADSYGAVPLLNDLATSEKMLADKRTESSQRRLLAVEVPYLRQHHTATYQLWDYSASTGRFSFNGQPQDGQPQFLVAYFHPVQWKDASLPQAILDNHYHLVHAIDAYDSQQAGNNIYSDGLYMPYAKFRGTRCPGPNIRIYARTDVAEHSEAFQ